MKFAVFFLALLNLSYFSDNSPDEDYARKPFEGIITYQIIYKSNIEGVSDERISKLFGTKLVRYVKGSKSLSKTFDSEEILLEERLARIDMGKHFFYSPKKDSISWYYCSEDKDAVQILSIEKKEKKKFLKHKCETTSVKLKQLSDKIDYVVEYIYYCSKDFPKIKENNSCTDKIDSTLSAMVLAWEIKGYPVCDRKFIPLKIEARKLKESVFKIRDDIPLKKI